MSELVEALLERQAAVSRPHRVLLALLTSAPRTIADLVHATTLSRRAVEQMLTALGEDVVREGDGYTIVQSASACYRALSGLDEDPTDDDAKAVRDLTAAMEPLVADVPKPNRSLDHVQALPETVARRAVWLRSSYWLHGRRVLFVGDHDLTSVALAMACPDALVDVVDIDEDLLAYLAHLLPRTGVRHRLRYADLRRGLPDGLRRQADLFVTDPPYTPEGVQLFVRRGLEALRSLAAGRGVLAYGYGEQLPTLGLSVQRAVLALDCVVEQVLPRFNRYHGAQAIGSASDWYVLQPTHRTRAHLVDRAGRGRAQIYTQGTQASESGSALDRDDELRRRILERAGVDPGGDVAVVDLSTDPEGELFHTLLRVNGPAALLVPNGHADLESGEAQRDLQGDVRGRQRLTFLRSFPEPSLALVVARPDVPADPVSAARSALLGAQRTALGSAMVTAILKGVRSGGATAPRRAIREALTDRPELQGVDLETAVADLSRTDLRRALRAVDTVTQQLHRT